MPAPLTETIGSTSRQERPNYNLRRIAALAGVLAVSVGAKVGIETAVHKIQDISHQNMVVNELERPYDEVKADLLNGKFKPGEVTDVPVLNPTKYPTAFAKAQELASDDIDVGDLPAIVTAQEKGDNYDADGVEHVIVQTKMLDPNAELPPDPNTHVQ